MVGNASTRTGYSPRLVRQLLDWMHAIPPARDRSILVGLSALQGSGKSTLAEQLVRASSECGVTASMLALDDFYLGRRDRFRLARTIHPLLKTRGVPGTHDIPLLEATLDALCQPDNGSPPHLPRFDKGRDTRLPRSRWRRVRQAPRLVILEGWCVGLEAESAQALIHPVNDLERDEDADGRWRRWVNQQLLDDYARLWKRLDRLLVLQAPGLDVIQNWRDEQERTLRTRVASRAMSASEIVRFLAHTERLSRHALVSLPRKADVLVALGRQREIRSISGLEQPAA
ncbi:kinase [Dokdonella sp.]|uniref:kinase n=1 Tax=Dokdonella sp. TaxID=2291710 RepID=UPI003529C6BA